MKPRLPRVPDAIIALAFAALSVITMTSVALQPAIDYRPIDALGYSLVIAQAIMLAWRSRYPRITLWVIASLWFVSAGMGYEVDTTFFPMIIALYTVGAYLPRRLAIINGGSVAALAITWTLVGVFATEFVSWSTVMSAALGAFLPVAVGLADGRRRERLSQLELEAERRAQAARIAAADAVRAERARIARELHDVVAHEMTVMTLQAEGAKRRASKIDPALAEALDTIAQSGRSGLQEMQRMIGVLRTSQREAETEAAELTGRQRSEPHVGAIGVEDFTPMPSLAAIPSLVRQVEEAGLPVDLEISGTAHVPAGVELSAYRIVQESLTNALKYAGQGASARVAIKRKREEVTVTVEDDGRGTIADAAASSGGHGLVGMRERVAALGGTIDTGTRRGGGYRVHAVLPVKDDRAIRQARVAGTAQATPGTSTSQNGE